MEHTFSVPRVPVPPPAHAGAPAARLARDPTLDHAQPGDNPFMSNMDEISYWICTKQAPCLFNYVNVIKRQCEEAHCSKPKSVQSITIETPSPKKKKKRKLSLLDDDSVSSDKQQNVYFETSQRKSQQTLLESCASETLGSDLDFNIKNSSIKGKSKRAKFNKSNRTLHKKNKIATSTPKVTGTLRRSMRKAQRSINLNGQNNNSFEIYNCEIVNGSNTNCNNVKEKSASRSRKAPEILAGGDRSIGKQNCNEKTQRTPVNGQFDDLSDVSGFTANYIRSTKIHSAKRNLRNKRGRNFIKESQNSIQKDDRTLVCVNKSVNTGLPKTPLLNCSTDSSQNIVNLITLKSNDKTTRVSRSTSLLKFVETKNGGKKAAETKPTTSNLNISFQSKGSVTPRYPKRYKNSSTEDSPLNCEKTLNVTAQDKRRKSNKNTNNKSDRKENPEDKISRTRSGKCIGLTVRQPENSVLVLSNSMEQVSSLASMNVATPSTELRGRSKRKRCTKKQVDSVKKQDCSERQDSLRDKSGFAACFSDSDEDNVPLKERKFFC